MNKEVLLLI